MEPEEQQQQPGEEKPREDGEAEVRYRLDLNPLERKVLVTLAASGELAEFTELVELTELGPAALRTALDSLTARGFLIKFIDPAEPEAEPGQGPGPEAEDDDIIDEMDFIAIKRGSQALDNGDRVPETAEEIAGAGALAPALESESEPDQPESAVSEPAAEEAAAEEAEEAEGAEEAAGEDEEEAILPGFKDETVTGFEPPPLPELSDPSSEAAAQTELDASPPDEPEEVEEVTAPGMTEAPPASMAVQGDTPSFEPPPLPELEQPDAGAGPAQDDQEEEDAREDTEGFSVPDLNFPDVPPDDESEPEASAAAPEPEPGLSVREEESSLDVPVPIAAGPPPEPPPLDFRGEPPPRIIVPHDANRFELGLLQSYLESLRDMNYYAVLGLDPEAKRSEVRAAYFDLVVHYHPDQHREEGDRQALEVMGEIFSILTVAYETLRSKKRRKAYDKTIPEVTGMHESEEEEALNSLFADSPAEEVDKGKQKDAKSDKPQGWAFYEIALAAFEAGDYQTADLNFKLAAAMEPGRKEYQEGLKRTRKLIKEQMLGDLRRKGKRLEGERKFREALVAFTGAAEIDPDDADLHYALARIRFLKTMDRKRAEADLNKVLELEPRHVEGLLLRGRIQVWKGETHEAVKTFKEVLTLVPGHAKARQALELFEKDG